MNENTLKIAVLISGTGSNLKALIDAKQSAGLNMDIVRVISNREQAAGLEHAKNAGIPISVISHLDFPDRQSHDAAIVEVLQQERAELIILAGYMRILGEKFAEAYRGRMINLHPSLLPLHKGLDTYNRVLQSGDPETGASIHFVTAGLDAGPVISQVRIPVLPDDDAASLSARLGPLEHKLVVATVRLFCNWEIQYEQGAVLHRRQAIGQPLQMRHDGAFI